MKSEREKMLSGELYLPYGEELTAARQRARALTRAFNSTTEDELARRTEILQELFGKTGANVFIEPTFQCDYGTQIELGDGVYMNFGCVILDCAKVTIGNGVLFAPNVHLYTASHPLDAAQRRAGWETAHPITIGDNVWIGGGSIVLPGVTIGENTVVGAGSVVTQDLPANVIAVGNPCRVIRENPPQQQEVQE